MIALEEIARWTRFMGLKSAREALGDILKLDVDRAIYSLSDGASVRDIAEKLGRVVSRTTIGARWSEWQALGIMKDSRRFQGRKEAVFTLAELGLPVPDMAKRSANRAEVEAPADLSVTRTSAGARPADDDGEPSEPKPGS